MSFSTSLTLDTNAGYYLEQGDLSASSISISSAALVAEPTPQPGTLLWSDVNTLGSSSLTASQVTVGPGGDFIHDWANPATGTMDVDQMGVQVGGRAFFEWDAAGLDHLTNNGVVSVGEAVVGNVLSVASYSAAPSADTVLYVSGDASSFGVDGIDASGAVSLGGFLALETSTASGQTVPLATPYGVSLPLITGASITGRFAQVGNVVLSNQKGLAVTYSPTEVRLTVAIRGDTDLDIDVDDTDLGKLISGFNGPGGFGRVWADGDTDGDSDIDDSDMGVAISNFTGPAGPPPTAPPLPGTLVPSSHAASSSYPTGGFELVVDEQTGELTVVGEGVLKGLFVTSASDALDGADQFLTSFVGGSLFREDGLLLQVWAEGVQIDGALSFGQVFVPGSALDLQFDYVETPAVPLAAAIQAIDPGGVDEVTPSAAEPVWAQFDGRVEYVPEPGTLALLAIGATALMPRRRSA